MSVRPRRTRRPLIAGVVLTALASTALAAGPARADDASVARDLAKAYAATAKFAYEPLAIKAGFVKTDVCVSDPVLGGMGYHYVNPANIGSTDPSRPAAVLFEDGTDGKRHLVAAEWVVLEVGQPAPAPVGGGGTPRTPKGPARPRAGPFARVAAATGRTRSPGSRGPGSTAARGRAPA
ncbi:hypothetical protein [Streptomyces venezuelae]|uniref:hypothetical protein n=1 Tax=Streptomyces venezuelae TaxID=54571 RepID=UPI00362ABBFC